MMDDLVNRSSPVEVVLNILIPEVKHDQLWFGNVGGDLE